MTNITEQQNFDVGILLPKIEDWDRANIRYGGLVSEIVARDASVVLLESHVSYLGSGEFSDARVPTEFALGSMVSKKSDVAVRPSIVRDLTMPAGPKPLYEETDGPKLVHDPSFNNFLRSKSNVYELMPEVQPYSVTRVEAGSVDDAISEIPGSNVVIKPDTGSASKGVIVGDKNAVFEEFMQTSPTGLFIVQEAIDMSKGLREHGVSGQHNLRFIVIDGEPVFGFIREDETGSLNFSGEADLFSGRTFNRPEGYSESFQTVLRMAQLALENVDHSQKTVIAIDLIRGINAAGEDREYVLEVNRRPLRNSPYDGLDEETLWASKQWDKAEARMLTGLL